MTQEQSEGQARRATKRVGLKARKSRWRAGRQFRSFPDHRSNAQLVLAGARFDCTSDDMVAFWHCGRERTGDF
jgi:hypothetical protein